MDKVAEGAARLVPLYSAAEQKDVNTRSNAKHLCQRAAAKLRLLGMRLCVLHLLAAGVELQQVVSHGQFVPELSDLVGPQGQQVRLQLGTQAPPPSPLTPSLTSSLAISSCSSSVSLRLVNSWFCFSSDWPIRAASSRSRSFCRDGRTGGKNIRENIKVNSAKAQRGLLWSAPPSHLLQQVGDGLDVMIRLGDLADPLGAQH